jgi:hypothetical protein
MFSKRNGLRTSGSCGSQSDARAPLSIIGERWKIGNWVTKPTRVGLPSRQAV